MRVCGFAVGYGGFHIGSSGGLSRISAPPVCMGSRGTVSQGMAKSIVGGLQRPEGKRQSVLADVQSVRKLQHATRHRTRSRLLTTEHACSLVNARMKSGLIHIYNQLVARDVYYAQ